MRVATVLGTRPEVIKLAPVIREMAGCAAIDSVVVCTGQHREMLAPLLEQFEISVDAQLSVMQHGQRLNDVTARLIEQLGETLREIMPDWVVVQGDTTTVFCAALVAFYEQIRVAHVEAGLRTRDLRSPFPEEANRTLTGVLASLHFCPTPRARENLIAEGVDPQRIHVTGNTVIDSLVRTVHQTRRLPDGRPRLRARRILLTTHRRENHGQPMREICDAVRRIARRGDVEILFPVHLSPRVREVVVPELSGVAGVELCQPLDYFALVQAMDSCHLVLTDSGGLQEEAPSLGKPVLVLRTTTERPEAIEAGVAELVGTDADTIYDATSALLDDDERYDMMARATNPFGDGHSGARIVRVLAAQIPAFAP